MTPLDQSLSYAHLASDGVVEGAVEVVVASDVAVVEVADATVGAAVDVAAEVVADGVVDEIVDVSVGVVADRVALRQIVVALDPVPFQDAYLGFSCYRMHLVA